MTTQLLTVPKTKRIKSQSSISRQMTKSDKFVYTMAIVFLCVYSGLSISMHTFRPVGFIRGHSMDPVLTPGDMFLIQTHPSEIAIGDIIAFTTPEIVEPTMTITHRIIDIIQKSDNLTYYQTQGDNNPNPDPFLVPEANIHGVVALIIPNGIFFFSGYWIVFLILLLKKSKSPEVISQ